MAGDIATLAEGFATRLSECQYAGELVIAEEELCDLATVVRRDLYSVQRSRHGATCMFVLAINCMYYRHDEQGFWSHFCTLLGVEDNHKNQTTLGEILESQLLECGFLSERGSGPFRFVTPLREQCGITRSEIPRFAAFLSWLSERHGWDGVRVLDQRQIERLSFGHIQSGHLARFVRSEHGYRFILDIARTLSQFQRQILTRDELNTLTGYRTGFFKEFFEALGRTPPLSPKLNAGPCLPRFMFFPELCQVGLCFDSTAAIRGYFKVDGEVVRQNPRLWKRRDDFRTTIGGTRRNTDGTWSDWSTLGWDPSKSQVAIFHAVKGFVDHASGIEPGEYFILGPYQTPPPDEIRGSDLGKVDLPFPELDLDAWRIIVTETSDLSFLGIQSAPKLRSLDLLQWSNTHSKLPGTFENAAVFSSSVPSITVNRVELFTSNAVALFVDDGKEVKRLRVDSGCNTVNLSIKAPAQGRIWVEPVSRLREFAGRDTLCELQFCLVPECHIQWPHGLYASEEQPEVLLHTLEPDLTLELEGASALDNTKRHWRVDAGITVIQGSLHTAQFSIPVARRVFRASLRHQDGRLATYLPGNHTKTTEQWILTGVPMEKAILVIEDGHSSLPLVDLGNFNHAGECRLTTMAFRDTITQWTSPVGNLSVDGHERLISTNTLYLDCPQLIRWLSDTEAEVIPPWRAVLDVALLQFIDVTRDVREKSRGRVSLLEHLDTLPKALQGFFYTVRACAAVFDDAFFEESTDDMPEQIVGAYAEVSPETSRLLCWYLKAEAFVSAGQAAREMTAAELLLEHEDMCWEPPFPRWRKVLADILAHLKADDEALPLVEEWKHDVEVGFRSAYGSRIANQQGGRQLTEAWIDYKHYRNYQSAINKLAPMITTVASPVADLAGILLQLCYMRKALFDCQPDIQLHSTNRNLASAFSDMKDLVRIGMSQRVTERPTLQALSRFNSCLPLRPEDASLISVVEGKPHLHIHSTDWLTYYHLACLHESGLAGQELHYPKDLPDLLQQLPASPEKTRVMDTLERKFHD